MQAAHRQLALVWFFSLFCVVREVLVAAVEVKGRTGRTAVFGAAGHSEGWGTGTATPALAAGRCVSKEKQLAMWFALQSCFNFIILLL